MGDGAIIRHAASTNAGGAISIGGSSGILNLNTGSVVEECMQKGNSGIIYVNGTLNIAGGKVRNNVSIKNGETYSNGTIATSSVGVINMTDGEISDNKVPGQGGAIYLQGTATITKVAGVFGELYKSLQMTCTPGWEVMSELDITYEI